MFNMMFTMHRMSIIDCKHNFYDILCGFVHTVVPLANHFAILTIILIDLLCVESEKYHTKWCSVEQLFFIFTVRYIAKDIKLIEFGRFDKQFTLQIEFK